VKHDLTFEITSRDPFTVLATCARCGLRLPVSASSGMLLDRTEVQLFELCKADVIVAFDRGEWPCG
jgi:hypothetical protein